jgi:hypothetical protein
MVALRHLRCWETFLPKLDSAERVPWCHKHGLVDLGVAEPKEGTCVCCGGEVPWEVQGEGFMATCDEHGVTHVHPRKRGRRAETVGGVFKGAGG